MISRAVECPFCVIGVVTLLDRSRKIEGFVALRRWVRICIRSPVTNKMPKTKDAPRKTLPADIGKVLKRPASISSATVSRKFALPPRGQ